MKENPNGGGSFKKPWKAPVTEIQTFTPNGYVAACASPSYIASCVGGYLLEDNGDGTYKYSDDTNNGRKNLITHSADGSIRTKDAVPNSNVYFVFNESDTKDGYWDWGIIGGLLVRNRSVQPTGKAYRVTDVNGETHYVSDSGVVQKNPS